MAAAVQAKPRSDYHRNHSKADELEDVCKPCKVGDLVQQNSGPHNEVSATAHNDPLLLCMVRQATDAAMQCILTYLQQCGGSCTGAIEFVLPASFIPAYGTAQCHATLLHGA